MIGHIKIIMAKGYGFITFENQDGEEEDIFFHCSQFKGDWDELMYNSPPQSQKRPMVLFKVQEHPKGPRAIKVEMAE